jgi:hypothetical protein
MEHDRRSYGARRPGGLAAVVVGRTLSHAAGVAVVAVAGIAGFTVLFFGARLLGVL